MDNKSDSNDAIDYLEKGNSCLESKKFEEAIEYYNKAIALKSDDPTIYNNRGKAYNNLDNYKKAIKDYDKAADLDHNNSTIYLNRGNAYYNWKKYEEAIKDYDKSADLDPHNPKVYFNRGNAYDGLEKYEEAIRDYDKAADLDQNNPDTYLNRGDAYNNLGNYKEAIKDYNKAIELDPDDPKIYSNRGNTYANLGKYKEAIDDYNKAIALDPTLSAAYFNRGTAYLNLEKYEEAIKDYGKAVALDPDDPDIYCNRGSAYYTLEKYEEAIKDYNTAADLDPGDPDIYLNRGNAYAKLEKYEDAIKDYNKAVNLEPTLSVAYMNRGNTYASLKKYEEAIKDFDEAIKLDQNYPKIYFNRGNTYADLGNYEEAIKDYNKAIELDPDDPKIYFNRGNAYADLEKYEEAIKDFNKATDLDPNNSDIYFNRGCANGKWKKYEEAIKDYDKAVALNPDDPKIYFNRGIVYYNLGKYKEEIEDYKIFITTNCKHNILNSKYNNYAIDYIITAFLQNKEYEECNKYLLECIELYKNKHVINEKVIYQKIGENYICLEKYEEGADYLSKTEKDPIEFLSIYENINQMYDVTSLLIGKSPECRFNKIITPIRDKEQLVKSYKEIYLSVLKIIYSLLIKDDREYSFAHYTTRKTASQLILDKSPLRLSSALTTNDPIEGKILMTYLGIDTLQANPDTNNPEDKNDFQAFIGCFSFNEESLNQFRLYGKENSEEATGVSIVLNNKFFSKDMSLDILPGKPKRDIKEDDEMVMIDHKYPLFRCLYIDPDEKEVVSLGHSDDDNEINEKLENIKGFLLKIKDKLSKLENKDKDIIENLFLTLRYLVKHAAFKEEQECRIICIKDMNDDAKKGKEEREIYFTEDYSRMYTKYQIIMDNTCLEKVIFGPKAKGFDIFKEALIHEQFHCKCEKSKLPFA